MHYLPEHTPLEILHLSLPTIIRLREAGIVTLGQLASAWGGSLSGPPDIPGIGLRRNLEIVWLLGLVSPV